MNFGADFMDKKLAVGLYTNLADYLGGKRSLQQFRDWFDQETWGIVEGAPSLTQQIAGEIELRLAEFTNHHRDEPELKAVLQPLLPVFGVLLFNISATSGTANLTSPSEDFGSRFGISGAEVSLSGSARRA